MSAQSLCNVESKLEHADNVERIKKSGVSVENMNESVARTENKTDQQSDVNRERV